ncbi:MAG: ABC transporter permease subunit [Oscillospiraceae bacterium]|nr:ABC transporter permease subunit [Oscillospiraceae bacterium]
MADQRLRSSGPGGSQTDVRKRRRLAGAVRSWMSYYGGFLLSLLGIIVLWYLAAHWVDDTFKFPMIEKILGKMGYALGDLYVWRSIAITMRRVTVGVFWGAVIGFPLGVAMGFSKLIMYTIAPFINSLRQIPTMSWVPLAVVWFGLGDGPTIFIIAIQATFNVLLATVSSVQEISPDYYHAVRSMGARGFAPITDVVFPSSMAGLITGLRVSIGSAWGAVV